MTGHTGTKITAVAHDSSNKQGSEQATRVNDIVSSSLSASKERSNSSNQDKSYLVSPSPIYSAFVVKILTKSDAWSAGDDIGRKGPAVQNLKVGIVHLRRLLHVLEHDFGGTAISLR